MQPFKIGPACRLEKEIKAWDSATSTWKTHTLQKPRIVDNPPPNLTEEQRAYLQRREQTLAEQIRLNNRLRKADAEAEERGPLDFVSFHYRLLQAEGFGEVEETPAMKHTLTYVWHVVDRYNDGEIDWAKFTDQVERWFLMVSEKLKFARTEKAVANV